MNFTEYMSLQSQQERWLYEQQKQQMGLLGAGLFQIPPPHIRKEPSDSELLVLLTGD
ncbi:hypothetical protein [Cupriavidus campinensis]|uniref:hypothetical protein n=1 Tax=Cupriavidus campinensis TaxID=151783 RepID=UPI0016431100|nr:hypothetical protein [Cupriavidus campinensis]